MQSCDVNLDHWKKDLRLGINWYIFNFVIYHTNHTDSNPTKHTYTSAAEVVSTVSKHNIETQPSFFNIETGSRTNPWLWLLINKTTLSRQVSISKGKFRHTQCDISRNDEIENAYSNCMFHTHWLRYFTCLANAARILSYFESKIYTSRSCIWLFSRNMTAKVRYLFVHSALAVIVRHELLSGDCICSAMLFMFPPEIRDVTVMTL